MHKSTYLLRCVSNSANWLCPSSHLERLKVRMLIHLPNGDARPCRQPQTIPCSSLPSSRITRLRPPESRLRMNESYWPLRLLGPYSPRREHNWPTCWWSTPCVWGGGECSASFRHTPFTHSPPPTHRNTWKPAGQNTKEGGRARKLWVMGDDAEPSMREKFREKVRETRPCLKNVHRRESIAGTRAQLCFIQCKVYIVCIRCLSLTR